MPLIKEHTCTSKDYWNLPEDHRAELIGGKLYNMAPLAGSTKGYPDSCIRPLPILSMNITENVRSMHLPLL